jgi:hypothetical protein
MKNVRSLVVVRKESGENNMLKINLDNATSLSRGIELHSKINLKSVTHR